MQIIKIEKVNSYMIESINRKMKKEFGSITKGEEEEHFMQLFVMEEVLLKAYLKNPKINSRRAKEAINICLLKAKGYIASVKYDFKGLVHEDSLAISEKLSKTFIPFENEDLNVVLKDIYDLSLPDELKKYFIEPIQCLIRIHDSVEYWEKSSGLQGYFEFLKGQFLSKIDVKSDKVNFAIRFADKN